MEPIVILLLAMAGNFLRGRFSVWHGLPLIGIAALIEGGPPLAVAALVGFFVWQCFPWGHLIGCGRFQPDRPEHWLSKALVRFAGSRTTALGFGHMLFVAPACLFLGLASGGVAPLFLAVPFGIATALCYEIAWRALPDGRWTILAAEVMTGAVWGVLLLSG